MPLTSNKRSGFTVVELIIGISITTILSIGIVSLIVNLVGLASRSIETTKQINETQSALSTIKNDLRHTHYFLARSLLVDDLNPEGGEWNHNGNGEGQRALILVKPSTSLTSAADERLPLYRLTYSYSSDYACLSTSRNPWPAYGDPTSYMTVEPDYHSIIYYLNDNNLYRRVLTQPLPPYEFGTALVGTPCPGGTNPPVRTCIDPTSSPPEDNCRERDVLLAQNVSIFDIKYYDAPGDQESNEQVFTDETTQESPLGPVSVEIRIRTNKEIDGKDNEFTAQIRANRDPNATF